ncbi:MAG: hypothetical protein ACI9BO_000551 [Zhongshania sp.]|jgi:hypothetical protein
MRCNIITIAFFVLLSGCVGQDVARKDACERTINLYARHVDLGEPERVVELFTADARWQLGETKLQGRDAIRKHFFALNDDTSRVSRHSQANVVLDWYSGSEARGTVYLTLYMGSKKESGFAEMAGQPLFVGHYEDEYVYEDSVCLIRSRNVIPAFVAQ